MPTPFTIADLIDDEAQDGGTDEDENSEDELSTLLSLVARRS